MNRNHIEIHRDEMKTIGIDVIPIGAFSEKAHAPHRDDHYMFIVLSQGTFELELDFKQITMSNCSAYYIAPGQVHSYLNQDNCQGWYIFMDSLLISEKYTQILNTHLNSKQGIHLTSDSLIFSIIPILKNLLKQKSEFFQDQTEYSLTDAFLGFFIGALIQEDTAKELIGGQKYQTVNTFKQLLQERYKEHKQVKDYASLLNITPLYLNEIVKQVTGFTSSYWIQQTIALEAKRLLYYTELDIKQIAFELGYDDHAYFSRFMKKNIGMTASEFRLKNHDLSNNAPAIDNH
ncbi:helix-turn-helix domain-containing protein [Flavobacterium sp. IB48]|uniref:helix-turn-helix domain-containing protein n=1 Tax=Flavobacterium sp. IB48 TaxID=2779375 RepID=UPI0018E84F8F|nr:helix-turn-helix domain-containing protein [Flavobacterium sp. IB48]MBJ2124441.1 helix-turn-helix domain-containing protein [Flavobacterium sp. IB48]